MYCIDLMHIGTMVGERERREGEGGRGLTGPQRSCCQSEEDVLEEAEMIDKAFVLDGSVVRGGGAIELSRVE